jgi:hypothetical protein
MRSRTLLALGAAITFAAVAVPAGGAAAATQLFPDDTGDTASRSDIGWVEVGNNHRRDRFALRVGLSRVVYGASLTVWVDSRPRNAGPEFRMVAHADSEWQLYRVDRWGQRGAPTDTCGQVRYSKATPQLASWRTTRTCLDVRRGVRVAVRVRDAGHGVDWAPARRHFFDRVPVGRPLV